MAENSKIQWTHHTFNPWRGCTKVSPGCDNCYAEKGSKRNPKVLGVWGDDGTRVVASEAYWREPIRWNRDAEAAGERRRVFCASLADVGEDRPDLVAPRERLCALILSTPWLDWLLLTKRPENMRRLFPREVLERAWVGTTTENQEQADKRIPVLLQTPAAVRFISAEPLLSDLDLREYLPITALQRAVIHNHRTNHDCGGCGDEADCTECGAAWRDGEGGIDLIIVGGESGHGARPFDLAWARSIVQQCQAAGVAVFVKQLGARAITTEDDWRASPTANLHDAEVPGARDGECGKRGNVVLPLSDKKGGAMEEWPADLRIRQFPCSESGKAHPAVEPVVGASLRDHAREEALVDPQKEPAP